MTEQIIDLRDTAIVGVQDPATNFDQRLATLDQVLTHVHQEYNGIDVGILGRKRSPHLYAANALAACVDIDEIDPKDLTHAVLGVARFTRKRLDNGLILVSARTDDAFDIPYSPTHQLPKAIKPILSTTAGNLELLSASFLQLRQEAVSNSEANQHKTWCGKVLQIMVDPFKALRSDTE